MTLKEAEALKTTDRKIITKNVTELKQYRDTFLNADINPNAHAMIINYLELVIKNAESGWPHSMEGVKEQTNTFKTLWEK
jgi:hypothetical protein